VTEVEAPETGTGGAKRATSRTLTFDLDEFGMEAFADFARRQGGSLSRVATLAARYYLADADRGEPAWRVPSAARLRPEARQQPGVRVEIDAATWGALREEARRQRVDVGVLSAYAILYFMSDVHSGRVAQRVADAVDEPRLD
jgi:hypothetical protein